LWIYFVTVVSLYDQGRRHESEGGGGGQCIGRCGVNTVKTRTVEKGGGCMTSAPPMVAPPQYTTESDQVN